MLFSITLNKNSLVRILVLLFFSLTIVSGNTLGQNEESQGDNEPLNREKIENLITTLESETARQELIENLKILTEVEGQEEGVLPSFRTLLNLDDASDNLGDQYIDGLTEFGEQIGLSGTAIGNIIFVALAIVVSLFFIFINKRIAKFLNKKMSGVRKSLHLSDDRFKLLFKIQAWFGYLLGLALFLFAISEVLGFSLSGGNLDIVGIILQYTFTIFVIVLVFSVIWEFINAIIELTAYKQGGLDNPRMKTLVPIVRNLLLCIFVVMSALVILSEFGIDIMPLLAGAGVVGIAIGFGAQTMVKDFLTGFIIIFEDLLQVGDVVNVGDRLGFVEKITIRKIQLRSLDGTVYTIPFSEVSIVDNLTKDYSYYGMDIGVAYREDTDEVMKCLECIGKNLREDEDFSKLILDDLEILGVDKFADSAVVIKARIKTRAHDKWRVGREFNRRMKIAFDENNIEIPFPHQTLYFGEDKEGNAPKLPLPNNLVSTAKGSNVSKEETGKENRNEKEESTDKSG